MIAEQMNESLILLRDLLNWDMMDIAFLNQNVRKSEIKSIITKETREILKKWLWADYLLYDHFSAKFVKAKEKFGIEKMSKSLKYLEELNQKVRESCVQIERTNKELTKEYLPFLDTILGYIINSSNDEFCKHYVMNEPLFVEEIYQRQKTMMGIL
jgi:hypothetical protein